MIDVPQPALLPLFPVQDFEAPFVEGPMHEQACALLRHWSVFAGRAAFSLVGPAASGKSHCAKKWLRANADGWWIDATQLSNLPADLISARAAGRTVVDNVTANINQRALLHVVNAAQESGGKVLITSRQRLSVELGAQLDLASRLQAMESGLFGEMTEGFLPDFLAMMAKRRHIRLRSRETAFLIRRIPVTFLAAVDTVSRLDDMLSRDAAGGLLASLARVVQSIPGQEMSNDDWQDEWAHREELTESTDQSDDDRWLF